MAEGVLFEVAARIISQLDNLVVQEIALLWGVKDDVERLQNTVSAIKAVLLDAEEKQEQSPAIKDWVEKLKDALYEADNVLDYFSTEALRREVMNQNKKAKKVRIFFSKSNQLAYGLKMAHNIKAIREKLDAINANRMEFNLVERIVETQVRSRMRETHYFVRAEDVIGREDDKKAIIEFLLDPNFEEKVSILPIVGIEGLGKTTLAQLIFNHEEIGKHFQQRLWVRVSDNFDLNVIVEKIVESRRGIEAKRYLLVLDDVWNEDSVKWLNFKNLLMSAAEGIKIKILVTTRSVRVAKTVKTNQPYFLLGLNERDSWILFKHMAFGNGQEPMNSSIKEIGKEILADCTGVPLLIKTVGSLLFFKNPSESEWLSIKDYIRSKKEIESYSFIPIIKLSFDDLPPYLKPCFAYFGLFPKDYKFHKPTLIQMWMAQGFIMFSGQNLIDVGHEYFMELLGRSFFQEVEKDEMGNILYFKIHDLIHDLAILVAKFEIMTIYSNEDIINEKTRHVSFGGWLHSSSQIPISLFKARHIRSFLLPSQPNDSSTRLDISTYIEIMKSFKSIRMLDLHNLGIEEIPSSIGNLIHLRYLDLSYNEYIMILPNSLTQLRNLQTLKLTACVQLKEFPRGFDNLVNLKYLEIIGCVHLNLEPHTREQLTNLQIVQQSMVGKDQREDLIMRYGEDDALESMAGKDRREDLLIEIRYGEESKVANLKEREQLQALRLQWIEDEVEERDVVYYEKSLEALQPNPKLEVLSLYRYWGESFPSWLLSLTNLVKLALFGCKKCQHLPSLDHFPSLKVLELNSLPALKYISNSEEFSNSLFLQHLLELKLKYCPNLKGWWQRMIENHSPPSFRRLFKLCIWGCPKLTSMPLFPFLQKLELYSCSFRPLEQTTRIADVAFNPLCGLESLEIGRMMEPLPEECLQNLVSLDHLLIYECCGPLLQGIQHLTVLKKLEICSSKVFDLPNDGNGMEWQGLRSLSSLCLFQLLELESLPMGLQHVTSLRNLILDYCPSLNVIPEWIYNLTSLQSLEISQCPKLKSLPEGICGLTSLQTLTIMNCLNFTSFPKDLGGLASLQSLYISEFANLTSLPEGICDLTSLQTLDISKLPNLTSLFKKMGVFASLETLYISECPKLTSLPEGMRYQTSLQTLCIEDCHILLERCKRETGEDWPKIAHIPNLRRDRQGNLLDVEPNEAQKKPALKCWSLIKTLCCCNCSTSQQLTE